jgi:hypothetical protein
MQSIYDADYLKGGFILDNRNEYKELARIYIKIQHYQDRWEPLKGLFKGTIFPELYRPYYPKEEHKQPKGGNSSRIRSTKSKSRNYE